MAQKPRTILNPSFRHQSLVYIRKGMGDASLGLAAGFVFYKINNMEEIQNNITEIQNPIIPVTPASQANPVNKIYFLIMILVIVGILIGGYFGYRYWQKGTPIYSFNQLKLAVQDHDSNFADNFIDADSIANNFWPRYKSKFMSSDESGLTSTLIDTQEKSVKDEFKNALYEFIKGSVDKSAPLAKIFDQLFSIKKPVFIIRSNIATIQTSYRASGNTPVYQLDFIFKKQHDRIWKMTDIQGLENFLLKTKVSAEMKSRDDIRIAYLGQIRSGLELYLDDHKEYPNSLSALVPVYLINVPNDPLDSAAYKYAYSVSSNKISHYHLGASFENTQNTVLDSDRDCNSGIIPPVGCSTANAYTNGFNGTDDLGCNGQTDRACYDLVEYY